VIATMFLRWHYLIDVLAGLTLAFGGFLLAARLSSLEISYREENGLGPVWMPLKFRPLPSPVPAGQEVER
jgi:membrane-associated phospholipid phosphatase